MDNIRKDLPTPPVAKAVVDGSKPGDNLLKCWSFPGISFQHSWINLHQKLLSVGFEMDIQRLKVRQKVMSWKYHKQRRPLLLKSMTIMLCRGSKRRSFICSIISWNFIFFHWTEWWASFDHLRFNRLETWSYEPVYKKLNLCFRSKSVNRCYNRIITCPLLNRYFTCKRAKSNSENRIKGWFRTATPKTFFHLLHWWTEGIHYLMHLYAIKEGIHYMMPLYAIEEIQMSWLVTQTRNLF